MIYCRSCGKQLHESARFCPQCGYAFTPPPAPALQPHRSESVWMAVTALVLSILTLLALLAAVSDLDTLHSLSELERAFGGRSLQGKLSEETLATATGGLVLLLPGAIFGIVSLSQQRGGRGMAIASLVINGINLLIVLGLFGAALE
ncbi:MAG: zinc ribbon domain-containing protein [Thiobacillaceae bacterium]|nr:zinc ribbon domain-containing protein [Thiobacillaceae bacterium]